ncbi:MAG: hypothetical protein FP824_06175 [Euryarchaeota archaeon]|nr:hypothetical protein [Euryarchaeota archaeon]MBU4032942.1 hypothetical protein [Candidatus Thermoplasmatota archaeon]MBU4144242.1 hypothetical protein [Candidatus Thermoplasmatota archaeon]
MASVAGIIFVYVIYAVLVERNNNWALLLSIISVGLAIASIAHSLQKSHGGKINFERHMAIQNQNLSIQKKQLQVLNDMKASQRGNQLPKYDSDWDPWSVILIILLIVLFIPFIIYVIFKIFSED